MLQDHASGERSQDQWSSGLNFEYYILNIVLNSVKIFSTTIFTPLLIGDFSIDSCPFDNIEMIQHDLCW